MVDREARVKELEEELSTTKYNKATQGHFALVKAKISKLRDEMETRVRGMAKGTGYAVRKSGDAQVSLLGFPSVGKSTILNVLANTHSKIAAYAFTTLEAIPGVLRHRGASIQVVDIPGIVKGAAAGTGRGKEVLGVVRSSDLILIIVDATNPKQLEVLRKEVYDAGIRLNERKPQVVVKSKMRGGISLGTTVKLTHLDKKIITSILGEFRIMNADVVIREDVTAERFIDAVMGNRSYIPSLAVFNKIDMIDAATLREFKRANPDAIFMAAEKRIGVEELKDGIFDALNLMRIYLKQPEKKADMAEPMIMRRGAKVRDLCERIHREFVRKFKHAKVWGASAKFPGQKFTLEHELKEGDIIEIGVR